MLLSFQRHCKGNLAVQIRSFVWEKRLEFSKGSDFTYTPRTVRSQGQTFSCERGSTCHPVRGHCTAGSSRALQVTALPKDAGLCCGSRLREERSVCICWAPPEPKGPKEPCCIPLRYPLGGRVAQRTCTRHAAPRVEPIFLSAAKGWMCAATCTLTFSYGLSE